VVLHYLAKRGNTELACFHSNAVIIALPDFNQSPQDFFNHVDLQLMLTQLNDSLILYSMGFSSDSENKKASIH